jgi:hypothetical protein
VTVAKDLAGKSDDMGLSISKRAAYTFKPKIRGI